MNFSNLLIDLGDDNIATEMDEDLKYKLTAGPIRKSNDKKFAQEKLSTMTAVQVATFLIKAEKAKGTSFNTLPKVNIGTSSNTDSKRLTVDGVQCMVVAINKKVTEPGSFHSVIYSGSTHSAPLLGKGLCEIDREAAAKYFRGKGIFGQKHPATESATYMNQERCEQIRSKIKNSFDEIGYNRITDIDVSTTDGYQIQINFDKGSDSSDVERAREICKEVLGNSWLESAPSDNRLMFTFGNANESCGDCKDGEGMILSEEFLKMTPEEQKEFLETRKDKEFKEKDVAMDNTEQDVGSVASDLTAQEGFFSNLKKKREEKRAKEAAEAAQYDAFVKAYGPKILPILKSTQAKLANRMKRALADVAGWQTKMDLDVRDIDIDDLFDYGCYLVTLGYKKGVDDDCGQREIYGIEEDLQRIIDESGRKICQLLPGNCSFHTDNGSGDDNFWEIRITVTGIDTSEFAQKAAQESSFKDMSFLDKATVIGGGVILFAALMNSIGVGNKVRELIARHKEKVRREREEKREAERKAQEALNKPIFDEYTRAMESIAKSIPAAEINKERQLRRREINELKATYQKYLNRYSKELRGSCVNFDITDSDVKIWLAIDDVFSDWQECSDSFLSVTADMNVIEWARNTYPKEWKEAAASGGDWDLIYDRCNDVCNVIMKMYTEFRNDTQNRFKTIRVLEDDWDKYEGFGFAELTASPEYLEMLRNAGFMEFDEWRRANHK